MAARTRSRPLYAVFLERVIQIEAVQRHRAAVTDDDMAQFFSEGRPHWTVGDFRWSLDAPKAALPWSWQGRRARAERSVSLPMQQAWNAAAAAFEEFIKALKNGELIASGVHPATGARYDLEPAEWTREWLILDVRNGELIRVEVGDGWFDLAFSKKTVRWTAITLRTVTKRSSTAKRGPSLVGWDLLMTYGVLLREAGCLPSKHASLTAKLKALAQLLFRVDADEADLRRLTRDIYAGRRKRRKRKRER